MAFTFMEKVAHRNVQMSYDACEELIGTRNYTHIHTRTHIMCSPPSARQIDYTGCLILNIFIMYYADIVENQIFI